MGNVSWCGRNVSWCGTSHLGDEMTCSQRQAPQTIVLYVHGKNCVPSHTTLQSTRASKLSAVSVHDTMTSMSSIWVLPTNLNAEKLAIFKQHLHKGGIDITLWGSKGWKSVDHLFWETYEQRGCVIVGLGTNKLKRVIHLVKINLMAEIFGVMHLLQSRMQFQFDGQITERLQVPLRKLLWTKDVNDIDDPELQNPACSFTEKWRTAVTTALHDRLGLSEQWQKTHLEEEVHAYHFKVEDNFQSDSFPGLSTLYCVHQISFNIVDAHGARVQCIGLPQGQEFATSEGEFNFTGQPEDSGLPIGTQLNIWTWRRFESTLLRQTTRTMRTIADASKPCTPTTPSDTQEIQNQLMIKQVPLPTLSGRMLVSWQTKHRSSQNEQAPNKMLHAAMEMEKTNWSEVNRMASRIQDPKYTLTDFWQDLQAFPELHLYLLDNANRSSTTSTGMGMSSSGRTIDDEYQRTVGAFFAIYWLMCIGIDGKDGFSFGVDQDWKPIKQTGVNGALLYPKENRIKFRDQSNWDNFQRLLLDAKLLTEDRWGRLKVNEKRVVAILALTAVHDIMKMDCILPKLQGEHAPFHSYASGDTIGDHDLALAYIMEYFPSLLPSFQGLDKEEQAAVHFTQCNLHFNHGWFVQAEAPPGAIFTRFRNELIRDCKGSIAPHNVAFYFVHWLTDLAGAEPTPLGGCKKFTINFPLAVLNSFLRSFELIEKIASSNETEVMEEYLKVRWLECLPPKRPIPSGDSAITKMRLLCMAQMNADKILEGFNELSEEDMTVLNLEMSRTGCLGQSYSDTLCPSQVREQAAGPTFLVYYGPTLLQNLGSDSPARRLSLLAEIYRCARSLWPTSVCKTATTVTIRIDTIKALSLNQMHESELQGNMWLMVKHNETEAFIELSSTKKLNKFVANQHSIQILDIHGDDCDKP